MKEAAVADPGKPLRDALGVAHADITTATKKAVRDDGTIFFGAAAALDVAVEYLFPESGDHVLAAQSCREALELVKGTRAYATRAAGGDMAKLVEQATHRIEVVLKVLEPKKRPA